MILGAVIIIGTVGYVRIKQNTAAFDPRNASFLVDGNEVQLMNGKAEAPLAPGSASKLITTYFGNEAKGDLNGDGLEDTAFLVTQSGGGSGTFYYAVVALNGANGYTTTPAVLIGDRIAPQSTVISKNPPELQVNYADRKPGEPMTATPSLGVTKYLKIGADETLEAVEPTKANQ